MVEVLTGSVGYPLGVDPSGSAWGPAHRSGSGARVRRLTEGDR